MRHRKWIVGPALVAMALSVAGSAPTQAAGEKGGKGVRTGKKADAGAKEFKRLEAVLGAPLTAQQKQDIEAATQTYQESVAKAVGLTKEDLQAKQKVYAAANKGKGNAENKKGKGTAENKKGAATPATPAG